MKHVLALAFVSAMASTASHAGIVSGFDAVEGLRGAVFEPGTVPADNRKLPPLWEAATETLDATGPLACSTRFLPDGSETCAGAFNTAGITLLEPPVVCAFRETPEGVVGSCAPVDAPNEVPAPGGLLVMMAAVAFAVRRKFRAA